MSKATSANSSKAASPADSKKNKGALGSMFAKGEEKNKAAAKEKETAKAASSTSKGKKKQNDSEQMDLDGKEDEYADYMMDDDDLMAEIDGRSRIRGVSVFADRPCSAGLNDGKVSTGQKGKNSAAGSGAPTPVASGSKAKTSTKATAGEEGKVRKTRRVMKTVKSKNAKGYMESKQVSTDEEYTASEDDGDGATEVAASTIIKRSDSSTSTKEKKKDREPAAASSSSKTAKAAKPGEQSSLKNFFGKPKGKK